MTYFVDSHRSSKMPCVHVHVMNVPGSERLTCDAQGGVHVAAVDGRDARDGTGGLEAAERLGGAAADAGWQRRGDAVQEVRDAAL